MSNSVKKTGRKNCDSPQKKKPDKLLSGDDDSLAEERNHKDDRVLVQDTEEDKMGKFRSKVLHPNEFSNGVIADSLVPDTEDFQPRNTKSNDQSVADSLVMETQQEIATSSTFASSSCTIPDSFVPESTGTQSTLGTSECDIDTIPDSQYYLDANHDCSQVQKCINKKENHHRLNKTETKIKPKKPQKNLLDQIQPSSDSSVDDVLVNTFVETFSVDQNDIVHVNQLDTGYDVNSWVGMDPKKIDPRLLKLLTKKQGFTRYRRQ